MDLSDSDGAPPDAERTGFWENDATVIGSPSSITPHQYPTGLTSRELAHALRGEMLGHFLLQEFIGGGGMGVVFKALDTTLDRIVAVKVVASQRIDDEDLQRRFLVEAQSTARLDHPNIARVHYIGRDRGLPYIVFEYIEGMNVRELVGRQGPLSVGDAIGYAYQIANALAHAWQRDVVHRDIKPSNILITPDGQAKLVDMGLARLKQVDEPDEALTATGITLGTFDYISPEQARDPRLADARSDIYSLGCTLFFMLTGQAPFANGTVVQKLLDHQGERPPDLRSFRSDIPDSVSLVMRQMLAKAPGDRQQTPVILSLELADILQELDVPLPAGAAPIAWAGSERPASSVRPHAAWAFPAAALLLAGLALDQLWGDGMAVSPFPELRIQAAVTLQPPTPAADLPIAPPPSPAAVPTPQEVEPIAATTPSAIPATPISIGEQLEAGESLWDVFANWPAPPSSVSLDATMRDRDMDPAGHRTENSNDLRVDEPSFDLLPDSQSSGP